MTLITYPTRVHFADDVLQEALQSELERAGCIAPLLVFETHLADSEFMDRVLSGLPRATRPQVVKCAPRAELRVVARDAVDQLKTPDVIIAFGTARAIELSRKIRYAFGQIDGARLPLYAIPGIDGLPNPCTRNVESWRSGLPSVLICDPTVSLGVGQDQSWRASVQSLVRCIESYLASAFNPPADGMALDGLSRCVKNLSKIGAADSIDLQRDLMAACLNASLSQEKGMGPTLTLATALSEANAKADEVALARLILPSAIAHRVVDKEKAETLLKVLGGTDVALGDAAARILAPVPMARSLSDLGIDVADIEVAAHAVDGKAGLEYDTARALLEPIL